MNNAQSTVDYNNSLQSAAQFIREGNDFLVISHVNPDGDAIGSTCSVGWMLSQLGKNYTLVNADVVPAKFHFLTDAERIVSLSSQQLTRQYERVICVDCADYARIGSAATLVADHAVILNIDHHPTNDRYGTVNLVKDCAASTTELLFDLVNTLELTWQPAIAESIYTGLLTDTGGFRYANTSSKVMELASQLLSHGISPSQLADWLLEKTTIRHIHLLKKALNTLSFTDDGKVAWLCVGLSDLDETGASNEDMEGLVNYPRNIEGVEVGLFFKQVSDSEVKVSFRSNGTADVSRIAQGLGGGGHVRASGATIQGEMESVVKKVVDAVRKELI